MVTADALMWCFDRSALVRYAVVQLLLHGPGSFGEWIDEHTPIIDRLRELAGEPLPAKRFSRGGRDVVT